MDIVMDSKRKSSKQIQALNEDELEKDLRFLYQNRSETADQFVEEAIPVIKYHINEVMADYQDRLMDELTNYLRGEIAGVILRVRREKMSNQKKEVGTGDDSSDDW